LHWQWHLSLLREGVGSRKFYDKITALTSIRGRSSTGLESRRTSPKDHSAPGALSGPESPPLPWNQDFRSTQWLAAITADPVAPVLLSALAGPGSAFLSSSRHFSPGPWS